MNHPIKGALEAFELHDSMGNTCAAAMYKTGPEIMDRAIKAGLELATYRQEQP